MGITILGPDGTPETITGGPYQYTPEGLGTGLARNSQPLTQWVGGADTWLRLHREQPWVNICVNKLTFAIARLPLKVYERDSQNARKRVTKGPLVDAITTPGPRLSSIALKQWMIRPILVFGSSGVRIVRDRPGGSPIGFRKLYWHRLDPKATDGTPQVLQEPDYWYYTADPRRPEIIRPQDVLHIAWDSLEGYVGASPLRPLMVTLRIEHAARLYQWHNFRNSVRPPGGVTLPDSALAQDPEFRREFDERLMQLYAGFENAGKPITLPPGGKWESFAYSASDAELIGQRKLGREEVGATYDLAPPVIGILENATLANVQEFQRALFQTGVPPWLTLAQDAFNAQVVTPEPRFAGQWVEFDLSDVLRGDPAKEAEALKKGIGGGGLTLNETRDIRNLPRIDHPNADIPLMPANNLLPVTQLGSGGANGQAAALIRNVARAGDRVYRQMKAGADDPWDQQRFERELRDDLEQAGANGTADTTAKAWAGAMTALVAHANGDPERFREGIAALTTESGAD